MPALLRELLFAIRGQLNAWEINIGDLGDPDIIDMINLSQEDMVNELPDNCLKVLTQQKHIASISGQNAYGFPDKMHKLLAIVQNADAGPDAVTAAINSPAVAGNVDNGTHRYKVTIVVGSTESMPSGPSAIVTITDKTANGKVTLTNLPLGPPGAVSRKIYRTEAGLDTFKLLTTVSNNTATTYEDNIADSSLTTTLAVTTTATPRMSQLISSTSLGRIYNEPAAYQTDALERPRHWVDDGGFYVYPTPAATRVGYFLLSIIARPTRLVALADYASFDQEYTSSIVWKTVARVLQANGKDPGPAITQYAATLQRTGVTMGDIHRIGSGMHMPGA